jgi:hypothetical protein
VPPFEFDPIDLTQPIGHNTYLTVDFNSDRALSCDWDRGSCVLDPRQVRFCVMPDPATADTQGCPAG